MPRCPLAVLLLSFACAPHPHGGAPADEPPHAATSDVVGLREPHARGPTPQCDVDVPKWERALVVAENWRELHGFDPRGMDTSLEAASRLISTLPTTDPRYVEAHCRIGMSLQHAPAETHLLAAVTQLRKQAPRDPEDRYAFLREPTFAVDIGTRLSDPPEPSAIMPSREVGKGRGHDQCRFADIAFLELQITGVYGAAGTRKRGEPPRRNRVPKGVRAIRAGTNHTAALLQEVEAALGEDHPYVATLREYMLSECDTREEHKFPRLCPASESVFRRNLVIRDRVFGERHHFTRYTAYMLASERLAKSDVEEASALYARASLGESDDVWIGAQQVLAGIEMRRGDIAAALQRLTEASRIAATVHAMSAWNQQVAFELLAAAALQSGRQQEAQRAQERVEAITRDWPWVGPVGPSLALARLHEELGDPANMRRVLDMLISEHEHALRREPGDAERDWRTTDLAAARGCLAAMAND